MEEKLGIVEFLTNEIQVELELFEQYNTDIKQAQKEAEKNGGYYWNYLKYKGRKPSRARIQENCKKIRQLMLEISNETEAI